MDQRDQVVTWLGSIFKRANLLYLPAADLGMSFATILLRLHTPAPNANANGKHEGKPNPSVQLQLKIASKNQAYRKQHATLPRVLKLSAEAPKLEDREEV